jgi:carbohydrate kinase (thermoresistant glucokinase family)
MPSPSPKAAVLIGVAGSGKTAVGKRLAKQLHFLFLDADDFHPESNIEKMKHGIPLTDKDRGPWLQRLHDELQRHLAAGRSVILACSALKAAYRRILKEGMPQLVFLYLAVDRETIRLRLQSRSHFFPKELMDSQFATLEKPCDAVWVDARQPIEQVVQQAAQALQ